MKYVIATLFAAALPFVALADERPPHPPRKPPPEAFEACAKLKQGDACSVTFREHTVQGTCDAFPDTTALACRPSGPPPGPPPDGKAPPPPK